MDTIYAESTPPGRGGISVVRLSGPDARVIAEGLAGPLPIARHCYLRALRDGDRLIDRGLVVRFDAGSSFTGEEVVEFQLHGAPVVVRLLQVRLDSLGARHADAGEFTHRGFLNGRMDLTEAEGLADLLAAETEVQHRQAIRNAGGALQDWATDLRSKLVRAGALVAASIDFADEELPDDLAVEAVALLREVRGRIEEQLAGFPAAEQIRTGFEVAIVGPPNAGKSSLLNAIARREVALVTPIEGTTRDVLEVRVDLGGLPVTFLDTAGLRETKDVVERMGIERAESRAAAADLRIHLSESGTRSARLWRDGDLCLRSKADLTEGGDISAVTGQGVREVLDTIRSLLTERVSSAGLVTRHRQASALERALAALDVEAGLSAELVADNIRVASTALREVVGEIGVEDYLDEVFSAFCIGK
ncbi:tRNA uridine-5-carboxymethylaminomethyl(34) synthesis GTPase MnmE [uncultured Paracoccus sp.]|uniref:tRNA uridine-5-carboxymethylaminomethyl(34) synthesis GTPase MnmE n=1 Tax=uncultured Paracoccus sp. TaxID=189685 RepID=UPI00262D7320|nr:tRNA uridine-5-carboxymethylaminomethyl(34) synthesis GTPase MnmE [uncultured Paracoccus sp.]